MLRRFPALALVILIVCLQVFAIYANDLWMHLLLGRDILAEGVPHQEVYSYTAAGSPFIYHEWLSGVILHLVDRLGGTTGLVLLQPLAALLVAWFLFRAARSSGADRDLTFLLLGAGLYAASFRMFLRPHLLALPLLAAAVMLLGLYRKRGGYGPPLLLIAVQVVWTNWTNLHGSFPAGIALAALFALGEAIRRRFFAEDGEESPAPLAGLALLPAALLVASLLNPYGWELLRVVFLHPVDPLFRERIFEYLPSFGPAFRSTWIFPLYVGWIVLCGIALVAGRRRHDPALWLPAAGFLVLSGYMNRAVADFVVVSLPAVAAGLSAGLPRFSALSARRKPLVVTGILLLAAAGTLAFGYRFDRDSVRRFGFGVDPSRPVGAVDYLERAGFRGNVFASFPYGSYVAYRLAPQARVVFDSRTIPYGPALYEEYREARKTLPGFLRHAERYRVDAVLLDYRLDANPELHAFLSRSAEWGLVYFDERAVLYLRAAPERDRLACASPALFDAEGIPAEGASCWEADAQKLLATDPDAPLPRFLLAAALRTQGRLAEALAETDRILTVTQELPYVHRLRAVLFEELERPAEAREALATAERLE